ncbi:hypothetical protein [Aestuariivirga litoralis]|uniref:hypothetical protein n=1 Tax=Aestuariivirga litoralis TaxID=2650924 RepID=UPI0018C5019B|nr:hypothetical protein [Aestuariivirga litoralis]MBG1231396.1 hypothetical protein [Aestuariivirga litoralis]
MTLPPNPDPKIHRPYLTHAPWAGYTSREHARAEPLAQCPNARCRRLQHCVAAHDDLYCQRTHISHAEYLDGLPPHEPMIVNSPELMEIYKLEMEAQAADRLDAFKRLQARWKAGEFDALYGKYSARGVLKHPPEKRFVRGPRPKRKSR